MKSLAHWGVTIGLIGSTVLTTWLGNPMNAFALPEADVVKVLEPIPVFTIADDKGSPLVGVDKDKQQFTPIFVSQDEATKFYQQLVKDKPDVAKNFKVRTLSLANIYRFGIENAKSPQKLNIGYVPSPAEIESAKKILSASGQQYQGGVPLFVARGGKDQGYLTITFNNEQRIPFFFEEAQLQELVNQLKKDKPDLAASLKIDVIPLESVLKAFETENDAFLKQVVIWPSREMWKIIEASNPQNSQTKPGTPSVQPATQPKTPPAQPPK